MLAFLLTLPLVVPEATVVGLAAEDFATREAAHAALLGWGDAALPTLKRHRDHPDREACRRVRELLRLARARAVERLGALPCIDGLWYTTDQGYSTESPYYLLYVRYLDEQGRDGYPFRNYTAATARLVEDLLDAGWAEWAVAMLLTRMRWGDELFLTRMYADRAWRSEVWVAPR